MNNLIRSKLNRVFSLLLISLMVSMVGYSQTTIAVEIQVSPNVLNLQNNGQVVTIHTDIAYSLVDGETLYLNGVEIQSWKADNGGYFVAKFNMDAIQGLVGTTLDVNDYNTFTLIGTTYSGDDLSGTQEVLVVDNAPKGKN